jgi:hypothetical protein
VERRYQVFVSSTYTDLIAERSEVMQALLELECMPAGMELFPAATETQWGWIRKVIDESDYYLVIVAGRYGSVSKDTGISYTEMEYRYAVEQGKPVIGFVHADPTSISVKNAESSPERRAQLESFRGLVKTRLCKTYNNPSDLGAKVSRSITQLKKQHPVPGWIRADEVSGPSAGEVLRLRQENDELRTQVEALSFEAPRAAVGLASGQDPVDIVYYFTRRAKNDAGTAWRKVSRDSATVELTWDEVFAQVAPTLIRNERYSPRADLMSHIKRKVIGGLGAEYRGERFADFQLAQASWDMILMQLRALQLIQFKESQPELTQYGDNYANRLFAVPKGARTRTA